MANDFAAISDVLNILGSTPEPTEVARSPNSSLFVNVGDINRVGFAVPSGDGPVTERNLNLLSQLSATIVTPQFGAAILGNLAALERVIPMSSKMIFRYKIQGRSFTELWYSPSDPEDVAVATLVAYVEKRLAFSGINTQFQRVLVTKRETRFAGLVYTLNSLKASGLVGSGFGTYGGTPPTGTNDPTVCLNLIVNSRLSPATRKISLRGIPDSVTQFGGQYTPDGVFTVLFGAWKDFLRTSAVQFGWYAQSRTAVRATISAMTNVGGQLSFTVAPGLFGAGPVYTPVAVRIRKLPVPFRFLNGAMVVQPLSATTCVGVRIMPFPPGATFTSGAAQMYLTPAAVQYLVGRVDVDRAGSRDTGKDPFLPRGRQRNRVWS